MLTLEDTYKAVLLKNMIQEELEDWKMKVDKFMKKGIVHNNTILRVVLLSMVVSAVVFFLLNSTVRPVREVIFFLPLFTLMGGCVGLAVLFGLKVYNAVKKQVNILKGKRDREFLNSMEYVKATEANRATVDKALKERCPVPKEFQQKDTLEAMIVFIQQGRAIDVRHAMQIIRRDFPYMLNK